MKKLSALLLLIVAFAFAGTAIAARTTHSVTLYATGWIREPAAGGLVTKCGGYAGTEQYWARVSTPTEVIGILVSEHFLIPSAVTTTTSYSILVTGAAEPNTMSTLHAVIYERIDTITGGQLSVLDWSDWYNSNGELGGISPGSGGMYLTEVTAASNAFATCTYETGG